jgi:glycosyltransferase involved in cell wall biosynthesis
MKVLLVMTARTVGGAELYVEHLTAALAGPCRFTVAMSDHPELADLGRRLAARCQVLTFPYDRTGALPAITRRLRQLGRAADVIHLNSNHPGSRLGILMGFALPGAGRPVVCVEQGATPIAAVEAPGSIAWALPTLFRWSRRAVGQVVAVSEENRNTLIGLYRLPAGKVTVVHNGADLAPFRDPPPGTLRGELGLAADQPLVIVLGRLARNKGQRFLVEAAPAILTRFPAAHFAFAGNPEGRAEIEAAIRALNLEHHFSLLGFRSDVANLLVSSDLFVLPSLGEGFALSLIEAMAAGLPVVATPVGGADEIVAEGRNGFIVPAADAAALAAAIVRVLSLSATDRDAFRRAAREAAGRFSFEATAQGILDVYRRALAGPP